MPRLKLPEAHERARTDVEVIVHLIRASVAASKACGARGRGLLNHLQGPRASATDSRFRIGVPVLVSLSHRNLHPTVDAAPAQPANVTRRNHHDASPIPVSESVSPSWSFLAAQPRAGRSMPHQPHLQTVTAEPPRHVTDSEAGNRWHEFGYACVGREVRQSRYHSYSESNGGEGGHRSHLPHPGPCDRIEVHRDAGRTTR